MINLFCEARPLTQIPQSSIKSLARRLTKNLNRHLTKTLTRHLIKCLALSILVISSITLSNAQEFKKKSLVSFNVIDIPVRSALQTIADSQQLNLVMSENVTGTISLNLTDVDWQQALQIILDLCGLQEKIVGNILLINTLQESEGQLTTKLETQNKLDEFEPLLSEFIQINYAKASDIAKLIKTGTDSILTSRGQVTVDTRTNTLLVRDTVKGLDTLKSAIET
jgi:type IV pilus assembly protein PilQ